MNPDLKSAFPIHHFKLAYETAAHKQVYSNKYDICMAIPTGKKNFLWITNKSECYLVDKTGIYFTKTALNTDDLDNTVFYGTALSNYFMLEDVYYYKGKSTSELCFKDRLQILFDSLNTGFVYGDNTTLFVVLPVIMQSTIDCLFNYAFWNCIVEKAAYQVHHIQYRSSTSQLPYLNQMTPKEDVELPSVDDYYVYHEPCKNVSFQKMSNLKEAVFFVQADIQDDVYHLFAYNPKCRDKKTYVDIAFIATLKDSIFMNKIFRKIRENDNIELGEESEDEDTFQNIQPDKYVDLKKYVKIRCKFLKKWRKWTPIAVAENSANVVPIYALCDKQ